jgi:hypothetical protein
MFKPISRRAALKGLGTCISLPLMEAMSAPRKSPKSSPKRLVYLAFVFGVTEETWFPKEAGTQYTMPLGLKPLEQYRKDFSVISNLSHPYATDVHGGCVTFLTGANVHRDPTTQFKNDISCDQVAAFHMGKTTRYKSIQLSSKNEQGCGRGLSLAWDAKGTPMAGEINPLDVFNKLFSNKGVSTAERRKKILDEKSVLDAVYQDIRSMHKIISKNDKEKLDEYLTSIRSMELDLKRAYIWAGRTKPKATLKTPVDDLNGSDTIRIMYDLIVAALQTDSTRVISYRQPLAALLKESKFLNVGAHSMSHYKRNKEKMKISQLRDDAQSKLLAHLLGKMKTTKDVYGRSLLDSSLIAYGGGIRCVHNLRNLPIILAGHGGGGIKTGAHHVYTENETPLSNLWLSMMQHAGVPIDKFSDSNGRLNEIFS